MALPRLETPTYELILPSTEQKVKIRPFLVKEYKILLTALESDSEEVHRIIRELIDVCTFNTLDIKNLPNFDLEYLFLNIRAKSIGELVNLTLKCKNCKEQIPFQIDITKAIVEKDSSHIKKITISEDVMIEMRYPTFEEMLNIYKNFKSDKVVDLISNCIESIYTNDGYYKTSEYSKEEVLNFVNSFTKSQFEQLEKFFLTIPKVKQYISETCGNCNTLNETTLEGIENFFI